jgi:hypothetical protein
MFGQNGPQSRRGLPAASQRKTKAVSFAECCENVMHVRPQIPDDILSDTVLSPTDYRAIEEEALPLVAYMNRCLDAGRAPSSSSSCLRGLDAYTNLGRARSHQRRARLYEIVRNFCDFLEDTQAGLLPAGDLLLAEFLRDTGVSASAAEEAHVLALRDREEVTAGMW